ncbi:MAG TPA: acetate--CoA ligase family protein [Spirochaetota bacterium]|nr:acetate--CoA ligase family protein [Spirochaetota bacterium]HOD15638.1 acetate--CoA ligase family protein [Spirochaetota bacterium]HPN12164.1 acetate--CoA ligase family protein [Spirochaetota bacterium]
MEQIIKKALERGQKTLSEYDSKQVIQAVGIPVTREKLAATADEAVKFAEELGYPVVLKGCSDKAAHKTEMGLVKLKLSNADEVRKAYAEITGKGLDLDGVLVQEMIKGDREFVIGLSRDPQFGPCVMFGVGGIFTEVIKDVSFRVAPLTEMDAEEMIDEIRMRKLLDEFRGSPAVDRKLLVKALVGISEIGYRHNEIAEIDINPVIISGNRPVVVDALVVLNNPN